MPDFYTNAFGKVLKLSGTPVNCYYGDESVTSLAGTAQNDQFLATGSSHDYTGGAGDDTYYVWWPSIVNEAPDGGIDTVYSARPDYTLADNVENLILQANWFGPAHGTGNALDNILISQLDGQTLNGGAGNDVLVGSTHTTFIVGAGNGSDKIYSFDPTDMIQLQNYGVGGFKQLLSIGSQVGSNTVFQFSNGESLVLDHVSMASLSANNFQFTLDTSKFALTFGDDFNSLSLAANGGTWRTEFGYSGDGSIQSRTINDADNIYMDPAFTGTGSTPLGVDPFSIKDGVLDITAAPTSAAVLPYVDGHSYTSGLITSLGSFSQEYGYFEARVAMPAGQGFWPAFWLLPADNTWPPEIDIFEQLGKDPGTVYMTSHYLDENGGAATGVPVSVDTTQFHTYGVNWSPTSLTFYIDDTEVASMPTTPGFDKEAYILANLAVGGGWSGRPDDTTGTGVMQIDDIRAYQTADTVSSTEKGVRTTFKHDAGTAYVVDEDGSVNVVAAAGVLANGAGGATAVLASGPSHGTLSLAADGAFTYTPDERYKGADSFVFVAHDAQGLASARTTVNLDVAAVNEAPTAVDDSGFVTAQNAPIYFAQPTLTANDSDPDGDPLYVIKVDSAVNGTVTIQDQDYSVNPVAFPYVVFTPTPGYSGAASFSYTVWDLSNGPSKSTATVSLTVGAAGASIPVTGVADSYSLSTNATFAVSAANGVLANDQATSGGALHATIIDGPSHGALALNADGSFTFTPTTNYAGVDHFFYRSSNGAGGSNDTLVTLLVKPLDGPLVANDDSGFSAISGGDYYIATSTLLANDTHAAGTTLTITSVQDASHGTATLYNGYIVFTPTYDYTGDASFSYTADDGQGHSGTATVTFAAAPGIQAPVTAADSYTVASGKTLVVSSALGVLANDYDPHGQALVATLGAGPSHGTVTLAADGSFHYAAADGYVGADSFTYVSLNPSEVQSKATTVAITVTASTNQPPVAVADGYAATAGTALVIDAAHGVLVNDSDPEGAPLTAMLGTVPSHGTVTLATDGSFHYIAADGYSGTDSFSYVAQDSSGAASAATLVTLTVTAPVTPTTTDPTPPAASAPVYIYGSMEGMTLDKSGTTTAWTIDAHGGNDVITGGEAADSISGGGGGDIIHGGGGNDYLTGGPGADLLWGDGGDSNTFIFNAGDLVAIKDGAIDQIMDFKGAGAWGGDYIDFFGFGSGATLTLVGDAAAGKDSYLYHIEAGAYSGDILIHTGGTPLAATDYAFL